MATHRVKCRRCDAKILPATAARTQGKCMPCHNARLVAQVREACQIVCYALRLPFQLIWTIAKGVIPKRCPVHRQKLRKLGEVVELDMEIPEDAEISWIDPIKTPDDVRKRFFPFCDTHAIRHTHGQGYSYPPSHHCSDCVREKRKWVESSRGSIESRNNIEKTLRRREAVISRAVKRLM